MDRRDAAIPDDEFERDLQRHELRPGAPEEGSWGWSIGRVVSSLIVIAMIGFWMWAFSPWAPRGHPDELDDATFPALAEGLCVTALDEIAEIPPAFEASDLDDRASQIETSTRILETLVDDLALAAPEAGTDDGDLVQRWLADWRIYISDRFAYAADFRAGVDGAFSVTAVNGDQVTAALDLFATINRMPSCIAPTDV